MTLDKLSDEALGEWRAHPVTELIRQSLAMSMALQTSAAEAAYWAGNPWPEPDRIALLRSKAQWEDVFEATAEDFRAMMARKEE